MNSGSYRHYLPFSSTSRLRHACHQHISAGRASSVSQVVSQFDRLPRPSGGVASTGVIVLSFSSTQPHHRRSQRRQTECPSESCARHAKSQPPSVYWNLNKATTSVSPGGSRDNRTDQSQHSLPALAHAHMNEHVQRNTPSRPSHQHHHQSSPLGGRVKETHESHEIGRNHDSCSARGRMNTVLRRAR